MWIVVKALVPVNINEDLFVKEIEDNNSEYEWLDQAIRPEEVFTFSDLGDGRILVTFYDDTQILVVEDISKLVERLNKAQYPQPSNPPQQPVKAAT